MKFADPMDKLAEPAGRCQFTGHRGAQPEAQYQLFFERPCGCITLEVSRPSLACKLHQVAWVLRGHASAITQCRQCHAWNQVTLKRWEKV